MYLRVSGRYCGNPNIGFEVWSQLRMTLGVTEVYLSAVVGHYLDSPN